MHEHKLSSYCVLNFVKSNIDINRLLCGHIHFFPFSLHFLHCSYERVFESVEKRRSMIYNEFGSDEAIQLGVSNICSASWLDAWMVDPTLRQIDSGKVRFTIYDHPFVFTQYFVVMLGVYSHHNILLYIYIFTTIYFYIEMQHIKRLFFCQPEQNIK